MQEGASISFEPVGPSPLEPWQVLIAFVLFVCLIAALVWKLRRRSLNHPGSLDLDRK